METIIKVLHRVEGSYALGIMFADHPEAIYAVRKDSPMIVGKNDKGCFIASDVPAILKYTRTVYYVDNQEVVELKKEGMCFYSIDEEKLVKEPVTVEWDVNAAEKAGYEYFMLKEIYEQPATVNNTILPRIKGNEIVINLAALRETQKKGFKVLGIVNVVGSSIAREANSVMYTWAGPEIAVATTKAYSAQLTALYILALKFARVKVIMKQNQYESMLTCLQHLPDQIELLLGQKEKIQYLANRYAGSKDIFFIGRGIDYAISLEGSLKLKEISYIHSEAYPAGELKHGTISLIEEGSLIIALATQPKLYQKTISNMTEVRSRGAKVMAITFESNKLMEKAADYVIYIPETDPYFANSLAIIPLQLLAYYIAIGKGCDVDKPRNLAKSVTVE